ncbi:hypothetical protein ON010_g12304 [Phytophthora cinnamomi]|nr:hypothetical protein ON010_g12304 [Phytophthora cinnamomi]
MAFTKKTVLVTGSTHGIGLALATLYTKAGWNVIGTARAASNTDKLSALSPMKIVMLDTSDEDSVKEAALQLNNIPIDLLINNAGTGWLTDIPNLQLAMKLNGVASVVQLSSLLGSVNSNTDDNAMYFRGHNVAFVAVHPRYVDTELTGGQGPLKAIEVAAAIADLVTNVTLKDSGRFLNADPTMPGDELPW